MFAVVNFTEDATVEVVPINWLTSNNKTCLWPPKHFKIDTVMKMLRSGFTPQSEWGRYEVNVMCFKETYEEARAKLKKAEVYSDIQTQDEEEECKRRRKRPRQLYDSDTSEDEVPNPKKGKKLNLEPAPAIPAFHRNSESNCKKGSVPKHARPVNPTRTTTSYSVASTSRADIEDIDDCDEEPPQSPIYKSTNQPITNRQLLSGIESLQTRFELLLTQFEELKGIVEHSSRVSVRLLQIHDEGVMQEEPLPDEINMPCKSLTELSSLNQKLESDAAIKKRLFSKLVTIGGFDVKSTVSKAMGAAIGKTLAVHLNWHGRGQKLAFGGTPTCDLLYKVVRKNPFCKNITEEEFKQEAANWLRNSKDREGGRKERERRKREAAEAAEAKNDK